MEDALVKNAADPQQVSEAREKEKIGRELELDDLRKVLATEAGRRLLWRFLEYASVFRTIWEQSARIHYNAGKQDFGHFIVGEITEANQEAYFTMMREAELRASNKKEKKNVRS